MQKFQGWHYTPAVLRGLDASKPFLAETNNRAAASYSTSNSVLAFDLPCSLLTALLTDMIWKMSLTPETLTQWLAGITLTSEIPLNDPIWQNCLLFTMSDVLPIF